MNRQTDVSGEQSRAALVTRVTHARSLQGCRYQAQAPLRSTEIREGVVPACLALVCQLSLCTRPAQEEMSAQ